MVKDLSSILGNWSSSFYNNPNYVNMCLKFDIQHKI